MSVCKNGLTVRHKLLELDEQNSSFFESEDYKKSENYWRHRHISKRYQQYLCAKRSIESGELSEKEKEEEKNVLLEARKNILPWCTLWNTFIRL